MGCVGVSTGDPEEWERQMGLGAMGEYESQRDEIRTLSPLPH